VAPVRCNPVSAPRACGPRSLAEVESLRWAGLTPNPVQTLVPEAVPMQSLTSPQP
jgi:hypothetical protein